MSFLYLSGFDADCEQRDDIFCIALWVKPLVRNKSIDLLGSRKPALNRV